MLTMIPQLTIGATDLVAAFLFMSGLGMLVVILAAFLYVFCVSGADRPYFPVDAGLAVLAFVIRSKVAMTSMLQMAVYNGIGGSAACAIAAVVLVGNKAQGVTELVIAMIGALIGAVSLSGSLIAWAKLDGFINKPLPVKGQQAFGAVVMVAALAVGGCIVFTAQGGDDRLNTTPWLSYLLFGCA